ncbi:MAG: histidine--tRNA ligase [Candidatus Nanoarchaeia archaeon]
MAKIQKLQPVRGMRDFLPEDQILRNEIFDKIKTVFENYGFSPWEAPAIEYVEVLQKKSVEEKLVYSFRDRSNRLVVLRPEKTPSLARLIASYPMAKPAKLYNVGRVWRYDRPQKGRFREFWQADIDIIGSISPLADAEVVATAAAAIKELGINFKIRINSRVLMNEFLKDCGVSDINRGKVLRIIDKLDKIGESGVKKELLAAKVSEQSVRDILALLKLRGSWSEIKKTIKVCKETEDEITAFLKYLEKFGIRNYVFDLSLVRGLDYYTGLVFEFATDDEIGSIAGGGRYDELIGAYTGVKIPATGLAIGIERIYEILKRKTKLKKTKTKVFVIPIGEIDAIPIVQQLRNAGISTDFDLMGRGISKNLEFASKQEIPYVIFVGKEELKKKRLKLRNMKSGREELLSLKEIIEYLHRH